MPFRKIQGSLKPSCQALYSTLMIARILKKRFFISLMIAISNIKLLNIIDIFPCISAIDLNFVLVFFFSAGAYVCHHPILKQGVLYVVGGELFRSTNHFIEFYKSNPLGSVKLTKPVGQ